MNAFRVIYKHNLLFSVKQINLIEKCELSDHTKRIQFIVRKKNSLFWHHRDHEINSKLNIEFKE